VRILLTIPTVDNRSYMGSSYSMRFADNFIPSLGLGYLAASLAKRGHEVKIHNPVVPESVERIVEEAERWRPDAIGLSLFTPHMRSVRELFNALGEAGRRPAMIAGGPHMSALPEDTMLRHPFDVGVVGEGEETVCEIAERIDRKEGFEGVAGTAIRADGGVVFGPARPLIDPLDRIAPPARDLMPPLRTHRPTPASIRRFPLAVMITSRGCPYGCAFCDRAVFGATYRAHSPEYVMTEMEETVSKHGAKEIRFFDDDIAIDRDRAETLAEMMIARGARTPWTCNISAKAADPALMKLFKRAGCWQVLFGLESGSDRVLKKLRKHTTTEMSESAVRAALAAGLRVRADFIVGTPGETMDEMWRTVMFAKKLNVDFAHFNKFVPFPGTKIHAELARSGRSFDYEENWSDTDASNIVYLPDGASPREYSEFLSGSYKSFYLRVSYIVRRLSRIRTFTEFASHVKGMAALLFLK